MKIIIILLISLSAGKITAQIPIGQWRDHLPYQQGEHIALGEDLIFTATENALFSVEPSSGEIERFSKVNELSDIGISDIAYHSAGKLIIGYANGNLDLLKKGKVTNLADIRRSNMSGSKSINNIFVHGKKAYLSTGFGIVVLDVEKEEFSETYLIRPGSPLPVIDASIYNNRLFAATDSGLYSASLNHQNLADFSAWQLEIFPIPSTKITGLENFNNTLFLSTRTSGSADSIFHFQQNWTFWRTTEFTLYSMQATANYLSLATEFVTETFNTSFTKINHFFDYENNAPRDAVRYDEFLWVADLNNGLVKTWDDFNHQIFNPGGPGAANVTDLDYAAGSVWAVPGSVSTAWSNNYVPAGIFRFTENEWHNLTRNDSGIAGHFDVLSIAGHPSSPVKSAAGTWGNGLLFTSNDTVTELDQNNTPVTGGQGIRIGGLVYDKSGNLWVLNSHSSLPVNLLTSTNQWYSFQLPGAGNEIGKTIISSSGTLWMALPRARGLAAYDPGSDLTSPSDDRTKVLSTNYKEGGLPTNEVFSVAEDLDGEIWVGTSKGVVVFYNASSVFSNNVQDAVPIKLEQDNTIQLLLEAESVTSIAVDGANRKWLGTVNAGVFLMSPDGTTEIYHFDKDNSPLLSNSIYDIAIDQQSGEVFFATEKGMVSFRSTATEGNENFSSIYVFPNPVRPEYEGPVAVKGLVRDAEVRITDAAGRVVYSGRALGGQAIWNGRLPDNSTPAPGVYLVFASDDSGEQKVVSKFLIIR